MKRAALIVNPFASGVTEGGLAAVEEALAPYAEVETTYTERPGHAAELAASLGDLDAVLVYSGDGGFNEVLNGHETDVPLGFLPGGRTNVLPRALGLPRDAGRAATQIGQAIAEGRSRRIGLGRVNGRRFGFAAGVGLDAELVRRVDRRGRRYDGRRPGDAYFAWMVARLLAENRARLEPSLEVDGLGPAAFVLVANCDPYSYAGPLGVHAAPQARFELGLDVVAPERVRPGSLPRLLWYSLRGRGHEDAPEVRIAHDVDRAVVTADEPVPLQADGEDLGDVTEAVFEAERDAVSVLV